VAGCGRAAQEGNVTSRHSHSFARRRSVICIRRLLANLSKCGLVFVKLVHRFDPMKRVEKTYVEASSLYNTVQLGQLKVDAWSFRD
jgi:hypothetical protein